MRTAIIDGDSIGYIIGWTKQDIHPDEYMQVIVAVDEYLERMVVNTGADHIVGFIGGTQPVFRQFTHTLADGMGINMKAYKESRGPKKPDWYFKTFYLINHRLRTKYGFRNVEYIEADDAVLIQAEYLKTQGHEVIICGNDKDLRQYPGVHYDYKKEVMDYISEDEAARNFWTQMITGDSTDDVEGIPGLGPKKAEKYLDTCKPNRFREGVLTLYQTKFGERAGLLKFAMTYNYLYILREGLPHNYHPSQIAVVPVKPLFNPESEPDQVNVDQFFKTNG